VDPVTPALLVGAARRCRAGIEAIVSGRDLGATPVVAPAGDGYRWCAGCAEAPLGRVATVATIEPRLAPDGPSDVTTRPVTVDGVLPVPEDRAA
jgi:hypothetical protein